jgi:type II secretory pathway pseudopilin PulG
MKSKGSVLIVAMILSAVIGISLVSYMQLSRTSLVISNNALYNNAAMNLAENGLEEAMYAINKTVADSGYNWGTNGWDTASPVPAGDARRQLPASGTYTFDQGVTGTVRVYVHGYAGTAPRAVARSTVTLANGTTIRKWVEIRLRKTSKFANGLVAKDSIQFKGNNASVDSWHSKTNDDGTLRASPVSYSDGVKHDKGSIGSISISADSVLVQNADIWGYAATGGALPTVGSQGLIGPFGTPANTMDMSRVSTDFSTSFDAVTPPANAGYIIADITDNLDLPRPADAAAADAKYYYTTGQINFNNKTLAIQRKAVGQPAVHVIITLTNATTSIDIGGGSGSLNIQSGSQLELYAAGDIKIAGNGVMNGGTTVGTANLPEAFQIWGTKTSGVQDIQIAGNGVLSGLIYAPQGSVAINGNGDVCGSVVANDITVVGNAAFHYDESLGDFGGNNPFRISLWRELTDAASRNAVTVLNW